MKITVHRGSNQIGGCVTEFESDGWKLFVDYGEQLPGAPCSDKPLVVDGLTRGDIRKSALLITHYHADHVGMIAELPSELPIYMGKMAKEIAWEHAHYLSGVSKDSRKMAERLGSVATFTAGKLFSFGVFDIMPVTVDHSAFDAYAFKIEANNIKIFHTGDFRTHGFRSGKLRSVIKEYVGAVDYVVCEATNVVRPEAALVSERELQQEFTKAFHNNKYNVVYVSSTNIDRLFGLYHASLKAHRPFYVDRHQKRIMDIVAGRDSIWGKSTLYNYVKGYEPKELLQSGSDFVVNAEFKAFLNNHGYVLITRPVKRFDNLLKLIPSEGRKTYFSMWNGYLDKSKTAYNESLAKAITQEHEYFHTSGHCDMSALNKTISMLQPKAIIPIHTDNSRAVYDLFRDKYSVVLLKDGESFSAC